MNYKVRIYRKYGVQKGNVECELYFETIGQMLEHYKITFENDLMGLNNTYWVKDTDTPGGWFRMMDIVLYNLAKSPGCGNGARLIRKL